MKKIEEFKWQMWQVHLVMAIIILLTILFWAGIYVFYYDVINGG